MSPIERAALILVLATLISLIVWLDWHDRQTFNKQPLCRECQCPRGDDCR